MIEIPAPSSNVGLAVRALEGIYQFMGMNCIMPDGIIDGMIFRLELNLSDSDPHEIDFLRAAIDYLTAEKGKNAAFAIRRENE